MSESMMRADARTLRENADTSLVLMMKKLNETYDAFEELPTPSYGQPDDELCANIDLRWSLQEKIDLTPAKTPDDLKAKAMAVELAFRCDELAENEGLGSFRSLSLSLARNILASSTDA